uniref:MICOS complex subunit MIC60 n=1 Tax=Caenorhabditis tropicalis TaxID=1561998 RepID=A0A1I7TXA1_9PELO
MSDNQAIKTEPLEEPEYEQMLNQKDALPEELRKRVATLETQCVQMKEERGVWRHRALRSESKAEEVNKEYVRVVQTLYGENEKLLEEVHHTNNIREELVRELDLKGFEREIDAVVLIVPSFSIRFYLTESLVPFVRAIDGLESVSISN